MAKITIGATEFTTYATVVEADAYFAAEIGGDLWAAYDATTKARALVTATRFLDALAWREPFALQSVRLLEPKIIDACIVIAGMIVGGDRSILTASSTAETTKRLKAGSVEIESFQRFTAERFPANLQALLGLFLVLPNLTGRRLSLGAASYGTDECSHRKDSYGYSGDV